MICRWKIPQLWAAFLAGWASSQVDTFLKKSNEKTCSSRILCTVFVVKMAYRMKRYHDQVYQRHLNRFSSNQFFKWIVCFEKIVVKIPSYASHVQKVLWGLSYIHSQKLFALKTTHLKKYPFEGILRWNVRQPWVKFHRILIILEM